MSAPKTRREATGSGAGPFADARPALQAAQSRAEPGGHPPISTSRRRST